MFQLDRFVHVCLCAFECALLYTHRLKHDVRDIDHGDALERVYGLNPLKFKYVPGVEDSGRDVYGFGAQNVREQCPELVKEVCVVTEFCHCRYRIGSVQGLTSFEKLGRRNGDFDRVQLRVHPSGGCGSQQASGYR